MSSTLPIRPPSNGVQHDRRPSLASFPSAVSQQSMGSAIPKLSPAPSFVRRSPSNAQQAPRRPSVEPPELQAGRPRRSKSQYPLDSTERHVEYILVASFHIDRGPIMEHQYPAAISGDESMLAELMLPDQTHVRSQDWTIFFLHKDTGSDEDDESQGPNKKRKRRRKKEQEQGSLEDGDGEGEETSEAETDDQESSDDDEDGSEGPPLMYVLNLVNTKQDNTVRRCASLPDAIWMSIADWYSGAVVKAMAICTRHSFLHIYKVGFGIFLIGETVVHKADSPSLYYFSLWRTTSKLRIQKL